MCVFQSQSLLQMRSEMVSLQSELQCLSSTQQGELQAERDLNRTLQEKCQVRTLFFTLRPRYTQCKVLRGSGAIRTHPPFLPVSILSSFIFLCLPCDFLSMSPFFLPLCSISKLLFFFLFVTPFRASILQDQQSAGEMPLCK